VVYLVRQSNINLARSWFLRSVQGHQHRYRHRLDQLCRSPLRQAHLPNDRCKDFLCSPPCFQ